MDCLEMYRYVKEKGLEEELTKAAIFNEIKYNFTDIIKGKIVLGANNEYRVKLKGIGNVDLSTLGVNIETLEALRRKNKYLTVIIVKHGDTDMVLFPNKTDPEGIADCILVDFIEYANIDSILLLDHYIRRAKEIELLMYGIPKEEAIEKDEDLEDENLPQA